LDKFIVAANALFSQNGSTFHARRITDESGKQRALIAGRVGKDILYQTTKYEHSGNKMISFSPNTLGLVSENGQVLRIDKVLELRRRSNEVTTLVFMEFSGRKHRASMQQFKFTVDKDMATLFENDICSILPENFEQTGSFLHEVGHLLRRRVQARNHPLLQAYATANNEFYQSYDTGYNQETMTLTPFQSREIKAQEERGAWAIAVSLIKEAGQPIGLDCSSPQATESMLKFAEKSLKTYDTVPYIILGQEKDKPVPAFSNEIINEMKKLHQKMN
jgi:hypothetical protein